MHRPRSPGVSPTRPLLDRPADEPASAPALWLEVATALAMADRRDRMSGAALTRSVNLLQQIAVGIDDAAPQARDRELLELARAGQLS
jgi:hypothetical protein